jgi:hypothetical protein
MAQTQAVQNAPQLPVIHKEASKNRYAVIPSNDWVAVGLIFAGAIALVVGALALSGLRTPSSSLAALGNRLTVYGATVLLSAGAILIGVGGSLLATASRSQKTGNKVLENKDEPKAGLMQAGVKPAEAKTADAEPQEPKTPTTEPTFLQVVRSAMQFLLEKDPVDVFEKVQEIREAVEEFKATALDDLTFESDVYSQFSHLEDALSVLVESFNAWRNRLAIELALESGIELEARGDIPCQLGLALDDSEKIEIKEDWSAEFKGMVSIYNSSLQEAIILNRSVVELLETDVTPRANFQSFISRKSYFDKAARQAHTAGTKFLDLAMSCDRQHPHSTYTRILAAKKEYSEKVKPRIQAAIYALNTWRQSIGDKYIPSLPLVVDGDETFTQKPLVEQMRWLFIKLPEEEASPAAQKEVEMYNQEYSCFGELAIFGQNLEDQIEILESFFQGYTASLDTFPNIQGNRFKEDGSFETFVVEKRAAIIEAMAQLAESVKEQLQANSRNLLAYFLPFLEKAPAIRLSLYELREAVMQYHGGLDIQASAALHACQEGESLARVPEIREYLTGNENVQSNAYLLETVDFFCAVQNDLFYIQEATLPEEIDSLIYSLEELFKYVNQSKEQIENLVFAARQQLSLLEVGDFSMEAAQNLIAMWDTGYPQFITNYLYQLRVLRAGILQSEGLEVVHPSSEAFREDINRVAKLGEAVGGKHYALRSYSLREYGDETFQQSVDVLQYENALAYGSPNRDDKVDLVPALLIFEAEKLHARILDLKDLLQAEHLQQESALGITVNVGPESDAASVAGFADGVMAGDVEGEEEAGSVGDVAGTEPGEAADHAASVDGSADAAAQPELLQQLDAAYQEGIAEGVRSGTHTPTTPLRAPNVDALVAALEKVAEEDGLGVDPYEVGAAATGSESGLNVDGMTPEGDEFGAVAEPAPADDSDGPGSPLSEGDPDVPLFPPELPRVGVAAVTPPASLPDSDGEDLEANEPVDFDLAKLVSATVDVPQLSGAAGHGMLAAIREREAQRAATIAAGIAVLAQVADQTNPAHLPDRDASSDEEDLTVPGKTEMDDLD